MSYGLGLYRFVNGEIEPPDMNVVRAVLAPYVAAPEKVAADGSEFWIRTPDGGEAEVAVFDNIIGVERPSLGDMRGVIAELADRLGAVILLPRGALLCREASRGHLPEGMEDDAVFVTRITRETLEEII
ncbi:hypothetical protein [Streptomyces acidiscabies]|uniref:hypothetical protein n=1 Tax=Streptomyces acidiscabies TaxID=42234 RepID=UPI00073E52DE|nr:hypothetical protein [Streptomyces acidiscabies]GAQ54134.1 hypothetical protein a10_03939 [Streptomyces acidiscabies]GAV40984.1 hypothetical protein Saa2_03884 [Streptomyces acidiscabies]